MVAKFEYVPRIIDNNSIDTVFYRVTHGPRVTHDFSTLLLLYNITTLSAIKLKF